ncbi:MAG: type 1 glutamine amidotransferase [Candidatus Alcyoniella australis]|nr:type 1 glutamine amidotransferase [Candidatus Alcyoniella australis]
MSILVVDNSIQATILHQGECVARILRKVGCAFQVVSGIYDRPQLDPRRYSGIIITGSEASINEDAAWITQQQRMIELACRHTVPLLGICFGHQLIARTLLGEKSVGAAPRPELGWLPIEVLAAVGPLCGIQGGPVTMLSHFDQVIDPGDQFEVLARSTHCAVHAMRHRELPLWGLQFHPEIMRLEGLKLLAMIKLFYPRQRVEPRLVRRADCSLGEKIMRNFLALREAA